MEPEHVSPLKEIKHAQEQLQFYRGMLFAMGEVSRGASLQQLMQVAETGMATQFRLIEQLKRRVGNGTK